MNESFDLGKKLLSIGESSEYLDVSIDTLRRWEKKGKIESVRSPGNHRYFLKSDLDKLFGKKYIHEEKAEKTEKKEAVEDVSEKDEKLPEPSTFASISYPTLDTVEEVPHFDRPVRDIKIPEVNLIRIIKTKEETRVSDSWVQETAEKTVTATSILTPAALSVSKEETKDVEKMSQTPEAKIQKSPNTRKDNIKLYIILLGVFVILIAFVFFIIGATSQEILSPVP